MALGLCSRFSWIFLLLFGSAACFPASNKEFRYPYSGLWSSDGGSSPRLAILESEGVRDPLVTLRHEPTPSHSASVSQRAPRDPSGNLPGYGTSQSSVSYYPGTDPPDALSSLRPRYLGLPVSKMTPSVSVQRQPVPGAISASLSPLPEAAFPSSNRGPSASGFNFATSGFLPSLPWGDAQAEGAVPSFIITSMKPPRRNFPNPNAWESEDMPLDLVELPPPLPSSYLIQSRNGYQRAREVLSHSKYSEDIFNNIPLPFDTRTQIQSVEAKGDEV